MDRTRDQDGIPVIPGLSDAGMIVFGDLWKAVQESPMDDAVSRLEGVLELARHHPALAPEATALSLLASSWWALQPGEGTRRLSVFELSLNCAREQVPGKAMETLRVMNLMYARHADLAGEMAHIAAFRDAWAALADSAVIERYRRA